MTRKSGGPGNVSPSWNLVLLTRLLLQTTHSRLNLKRIETGSGNWSCLSYSGRCLLACAWPINPLLHNSSTALRSIGRGYVVCVCVCVCVGVLCFQFFSLQCSPFYIVHTITNTTGSTAPLVYGVTEHLRWHLYVSLVHTFFWKNPTGISYPFVLVLFVALKKRNPWKICILSCIIK